jgi:MHS family alpha-ketoglutarate permease-like MFS transporter
MAESLDQAAPVIDAPVTPRWRAVGAGAVGNFTEFFDWTIYSYMAPVFASQFFPAHDQAASLLLAFSTFALGYLMRPIGGIVLGRLSDARGRRDALSLSILLMGLGSLVIGLLPAYGTLGLAAPILLILMRLLQGFSAGGEGGVSATFLLEFAPPGRRALAGSWRDFSSGVSTFVALGVSTAVTSLLPHDALVSWGWRIPFLVGALFSLVGLMLRRRVTETPVFAAHRATQDGKAAQPVHDLVKRDRRPLVIVMLISVLPTVAFLTWQIYLPTYVSSVTSMPLATAQQISLLGVLVYLVLIPVMAMLADRVGRRPIMITFAVASALWAYPTYVLLSGSTSAVLLVTIVGNVVVALMAGCLTATMAEQFPTATRGSGVSLAYAVAASVVGGSFPIIVTYLASQGSRLIIFLIVVAAALISGIAFYLMPETRTREL